MNDFILDILRDMIARSSLAALMVLVFFRRPENE